MGKESLRSVGEGSEGTINALFKVKRQSCKTEHKRGNKRRNCCSGDSDINLPLTSLNPLSSRGSDIPQSS